MSEQQKAPNAVQYTGQERTRQIWGRWVEPGEIIAEPKGLVLALAKCSDFQIVDVSLPPSESDEGIEAVTEEKLEEGEV